MSSLSNADVKELVRSKTDIVALIGETLALQPRHGGRLYVGLCPFHEDHNPSFNVNPERQTYRCWSCNEGGDCFSYVMKAESLGFREALEFLANRAGVELPQHGPQDRQSRDEKAALYEVLLWAVGEFQRGLAQEIRGARARKYLKERNFTQETLSRFQIGYAAEGWDWLLERARGRFTPEVLVRAGLAKANDPPRGGHRDAYVDRVMFPICDERSRVISFGGRILPDSQIQNTGKYINGTDTPVFHKSKVIFGFDQAREAIRKTGTAIVTEGYADCIKAQQAGVLNAVGTLGTALTETHVSILKRSASRVVLVYDGDKAGQDAAVRAVERFLAQDVDLRILTLPDELDPDEFLEEHGVDAFENLITQAPEAWEYFLQRCLATHGKTVEGQRQALDEMLQLLTVVPGLSGSVRETVLLSRVAQRLRVREEMVRSRLREMRTGRKVSPARKVPAADVLESDDAANRRASAVSLQQSRQKDDLLETEILQVLWTAPHTIQQIRQEVGTDDFRNEAARELLATCFDMWDHGELPEFGRVLAALECPHLKSLAVWIDEQATARRVADLLMQEAANRSNEAPSGEQTGGLLQQLLRDITWRREVERQRSSLIQSAGELEQSTGLNLQLRELLARESHFHQRRASRNPPSSSPAGS